MCRLSALGFWQEEMLAEDLRREKRAEIETPRQRTEPLPIGTGGGTTRARIRRLGSHLQVLPEAPVERFDFATADEPSQFLPVVAKTRFICSRGGPKESLADPSLEDGNAPFTLDGYPQDSRELAAHPGIDPLSLPDFAQWNRAYKRGLAGATRACYGKRLQFDSEVGEVWDGA